MTACAAPFRRVNPKTSEAFVACIATLYRGARVEPDGPAKDDALAKRPLALAWLAAQTVGTLSSCLPPADPRTWDWEGLLAAASDREDRAGAYRAQTSFREAWNAVLEHESECAARVLEVMRAWLWAVEGASHVRAQEGDSERAAQHDEHAIRCRVFLSEQWGIRLAEPPPMHQAPRIAARLTRRYDLMPRNVREWSPE